MGMEARHGMDWGESGKLNKDADKGNILKLFFYEWERGTCGTRKESLRNHLLVFLKNKEFNVPVYVQV